MFNYGHNTAVDSGNAVEVLSERYLAEVFQYVSYWVNNTRIAEDLTLAVFKKALYATRNVDQDKEDFPLRLFTLARHSLLASKQMHWPTEIKTQAYDYVDEAGSKARYKLQAGLASLSLREKEIVTLKLSSNLGNRCIGRILRLSEAEVGMKLYQALCKLKGYLEEPLAAGPVRSRR